MSDTPRTDAAMTTEPNDPLSRAYRMRLLAEELERENARLREALGLIVKWELPASGRNWDGGGPMSYGAAFGSNGEREYMRTLALHALSALPNAEAQR